MYNFLLIWSLARDVIAFYHQYKISIENVYEFVLSYFKISPHRKFYIGYTRYSNKDAMEPVHVEFKGQPRRGLIERRFTSFTALLLIFSLRLCYHFFFLQSRTHQHCKTGKPINTIERHIDKEAVICQSLLSSPIPGQKSAASWMPGHWQEHLDTGTYILSFQEPLINLRILYSCTRWQISA